LADLSVTANSVARGSAATQTTGTAGASITAGQTVYLDSSTSTIKLADCDGATALQDTVGIALHAAISGQPITYQKSGNINVGATLVVGETYMLSDTPGGIMPIADLETGDTVVYLGYATTASNLFLNIQNSGVTHA
jgi:hypothetical protein